MMSSPGNNLPSKDLQNQVSDNNNNNNHLRKAPESSKKPQEQQQQQQQHQQQQQQPQKCPRCDSANTKFCYYNNYSLTQPRHFCKTCRRYWTKGGALRNVPIGGGCRKSKKIRSSSSSSTSRFSSEDDNNNLGGGGGGSTSSDINGFRFLHGFAPTLDFQLGGSLPYNRLINPSPTGFLLNNNLNHNHNQFSSLDQTATSPASCFNLDQGGSSMLGFNGFSTTGFNNGGIVQENNMGGSMNVNSSLASSIESLSSLNQDLHWKMQQQRLSMLFGEGDYHKDQTNLVSGLENQTLQRPQPILFQNLEIPSKLPEASHVRKENGGGGGGVQPATEWFFGNSTSYGNTSNNNNPSGSTSTAPPPTVANTNSGAVNINNGNWGTGSVVQGWSDLPQFNGLP